MQGWAAGTFLEFDFPSAPVAAVVDAFFENGFVLLRRCVDGDRLAALLSIIDPLYDDAGQVEDDYLASRGRPLLHEHLFDERHLRLVAAVFSGRPYAARFTHTRRIDPQGLRERWQMPLGPHIDAPFHSFAFTVNFWLPFQPCGRNRPSLAVVRGGFDEAIAFAEYDGGPEEPDQEGRFRRFAPIMVGLADFESEAMGQFRARLGHRVYAPEYDVGDAMMLSNWTLHLTHAGNAATEPREDVELRFVSEMSLAEARAAHRPREP